MDQVVIYTTGTCGCCQRAKAWLVERGVLFREIDVTGDDQGRRELVEKTGPRTVPQIFVGDVHVGGYMDLVALDRVGALTPLLNSAGA